MSKFLPQSEREATYNMKNKFNNYPESIGAVDSTIIKNGDHMKLKSKKSTILGSTNYIVYGFNVLLTLMVFAFTIMVIIRETKMISKSFKHQTQLVFLLM